MGRTSVWVWLARRWQSRWTSAWGDFLCPVARMWRQARSMVQLKAPTAGYIPAERAKIGRYAAENGPLSYAINTENLHQELKLLVHSLSHGTVDSWQWLESDHEFVCMYIRMYICMYCVSISICELVQTWNNGWEIHNSKDRGTGDKDQWLSSNSGPMLYHGVSATSYRSSQYQAWGTGLKRPLNSSTLVTGTKGRLETKDLDWDR